MPETRGIFAVGRSYPNVEYAVRALRLARFEPYFERGKLVEWRAVLEPGQVAIARCKRCATGERVIVTTELRVVKPFNNDDTST